MRVIVGCEFSQIVTLAFRKNGHKAFSCDILPAEGGHPEWHFQEDIFEVLKREKFDLGIFHPVCKYLCNSGVKWLYKNGKKINGKNLGRWEKMRLATDFFNKLLFVNISMIAIENPIMHEHASKLIKLDYDQIIQPWQFGHGEKKSTCLWLRNLPKLKPTKIVNGREARIHKMSPGPDRSKKRSIFFPGIAAGMANQWG